MITFSLSIPTGIAHQYDAKELESGIQVLLSCFGEDLARILPSSVSGTGELDWIIDTAARFAKLQRCRGFAEHCRLYVGDRASATFVAQLAELLVEKVESLEFEPAIPDSACRGDILVCLGGQPLYLECKSPGPHHDQALQDEHVCIARLFQSVIPKGCQLDVRYREPMNDEQWQRLATSVASRCGVAANLGVLVDNDEVHVQLTRASNMAHPPLSEQGMEMILGGLCENTMNHEVVLFHVLSTAQGAVSVGGPSVDRYRKTLEACFLEARAQAPKDHEFVLVVNSGFMTGKLSENIRTLNTRFQPDRNTRFSAAILLNTLGDSAALHLSVNPFASNPMRGELQTLFRGLDGVRVRGLPRS